MAAWWNSLTLLGQILACIAVPSTLIMLIQLIMMIVGMAGGGDASDSDIGDVIDLDGDGIPDGIDLDGDGIPDTDVDGAEHDGSGFRFLTFRGIITFFAMFGWSGLVLLRCGVGQTLSLIFAFLIGFAVMIAVGFAFGMLYRLQSDGTINVKNALGVNGEVYLRIPASRTGQGKVNVVVQGTYGEYEAVTDEEKPLEYGEEVTVVGIDVQNVLIVKRK